MPPRNSPGEAFDRAYRMLRMRRVIARTGNGYVVLPRGRELVSYYANSIAQLLGSYEVPIARRNALRDALIGAGASRTT